MISSACNKKKQCPVKLLAAGDLSQKCIRAGDTVRLKQERETRTVREVTTDYGPTLGDFQIPDAHKGGRRLNRAAAILILNDNTVRYVDENIEKVCPECGTLVQEFHHGFDL